MVQIKRILLQDPTLAERRYAARDPDNRLIASEPEKRWEETLSRAAAFEDRLNAEVHALPDVDTARLDGLADDLRTAWAASTTTMRDKQRRIRTLIEDIVADIDDKTGEIVLVVDWKGGRHTELRVMKPKAGEHTSRTGAGARAIMRNMAGRWSDAAIAACLNRMGMPTGRGKTWNARRVLSIRRVNDIDGDLWADKTGSWRTMSQAAQEMGETSPVIRG